LSIGDEKTVGPARHPEERNHFSPPNIAARSIITWRQQCITFRFPFSRELKLRKISSAYIKAVKCY
jgi:hypothetical protein